MKAPGNELAIRLALFLLLLAGAGPIFAQDIEPRRWTLGVPGAGATERLVRPLQIERREGAGAGDRSGRSSPKPSAPAPKTLSPQKGARQS